MPLEFEFVLFGCFIAVVTDIRSRKIPNAVPAALALVALGFAAVHGPIAVLIAVLLMVAMLALGTLAFSRGWLGGGDVKLLAAVAGCLGAADAVPFLVYTAIGGGVIGACIALANRRLPDVVRSAFGILRPIALGGPAALAPPPPHPLKMPYALAIGSGVTLVALSHSVAPFLRLPL
jgi:prepilin peptidase CpaA